MLRYPQILTKLLEEKGEKLITVLGCEGQPRVGSTSPSPLRVTETNDSLYPLQRSLHTRYTLYIPSSTAVYYYTVFSTKHVYTEPLCTYNIQEGSRAMLP